MAIDRDLVVRTALELLDEHGLDKLTVRRVASALDVQAPALYWHFSGKRALLDRLTDAMLAPAAAGLGTRGPWWEWVSAAMEALRGALLAHRDGARVALGAGLLDAVALGTFVERTTQVLAGAGFELADASRAAAALVHFTVGRTVEEQSRPPADLELAAASSPDFPFPTLGRALVERHAAGSSPDDDFRYSLGIMLTGLRATGR
ncbi:TetR/AcrR family transcriptional regulator C-terminal domain-containing protein [Nonomuraea sp. NPDC050556]|uniref:TetR/AcrR family transcriptional regulator C-terminal domain-containing protein n=1 Tax=Nonomuraea sp. NPDC050556 TaxID=3364369 RepID=UPI003796ABAF